MFLRRWRSCPARVPPLTRHSAMTAEHGIELVCHPSTPTDAVRGIHAVVRRTADAELKLRFAVGGDISRILLSSPGTSDIGTELWRHTCFEAFIAVEGQPAYHEFNFAPSGQWAMYEFSSYRNGGPVANDMMCPQIYVSSAGNRLELDAIVRLDGLSATHPHASLRIGLPAVIETSDGLSYWALRHPPGKPDFHDAKGFALLLASPGLG